MSEDYIHVDQAVEVVVDNGWLTAKDIYEYILMWSETDIEFRRKILSLLNSLKKELILYEIVEGK